MYIYVKIHTRKKKKRKLIREEKLIVQHFKQLKGGREMVDNQRNGPKEQNRPERK